MRVGAKPATEPTAAPIRTAIFIMVWCCGVEGILKRRPRHKIKTKEAKKIMKSVLVLATLASASAFAPAPIAKTSSALAVEKSKALPFLPTPSNLDGYIGNVGFDPLGVSNYFPVDYLREAELKHGRMCQLAWLGYVAVDLGMRIPGYPEAMSTATSASAHGPAVEYGALGNILVWIAFAEMTSWIGVSQMFLWFGLLEVIDGIAIMQMLEGSGRAPGDF